MTLFDATDGGDFFRPALDRFFAGKRDDATLTILSNWNSGAQMLEGFG